MSNDQASCQLYALTPPKIVLANFADDLARTLDLGVITCLQLRLKDISEDDLKRAIEVLKPITQERDVAFVLNDRADLAAQFECDGVHVGQEDIPYKEARKIVGPNAIVGVTCNASKHLAMTAGEQGADYVAFGAFYPTTTKDAKTMAEPWILEWWSSLFEVPCVAIGGITVENAAPLVEAGADFLAVSSGIWNHPQGPIAAVKEFASILNAA